MTEISWGIAAVWMGLALLASFISIRFNLSVALVEILVGIAAGNLAMLLNQHHVFGVHWNLEATEWIRFLAGFGSILLTFMAGAEIEPSILRRYFKESLAIGTASFAAPFFGALLYAHYISGWDWSAATICGIALSTTSVAVVYAVMIETGLNETDFGKLLLAACFVTDLGTVVALGVCFANYDQSMLIFAIVAAIVLWLAPRFVQWFFTRFSTHVSEPGVKMVFFVLFGLGALATLSNSEAVLPAYMVGLALAGVFARQRDTIRRLRTTVFAFLTPFYFLNAGMKVNAVAVGASLDPDRDPACGEADHEDDRSLAADPALPVRLPRQRLYDALDVDGPYVRHDQRPVRLDARLYRSGRHVSYIYQPRAVFCPGDGRDRQRDRADDDRAEVLSAGDRAQGRAGGRAAGACGHGRRRGWCRGERITAAGPA